ALPPVLGRRRPEIRDGLLHVVQVALELVAKPRGRSGRLRAVAGALLLILALERRHTFVQLGDILFMLPLHFSGTVDVARRLGRRCTVAIVNRRVATAAARAQCERQYAYEDSRTVLHHASSRKSIRHLRIGEAKAGPPLATNPDAHCPPMELMQFHEHPQPRKIVQTPDRRCFCRNCSLSDCACVCRGAEASASGAALHRFFPHGSGGALRLLPDSLLPPGMYVRLHDGVLEHQTRLRHGPAEISLVRGEAFPDTPAGGALVSDLIPALS